MSTTKAKNKITKFKVARAPSSGKVVIVNTSGPATEKLSATVRKGRKEQIRKRVGSRGLSAYVDAAIARQLELDALSDLVDDLAEIHGPATEEEIQAALAAWPSASS
ncbi:hypothetical protein ACRYCC_37745 [Actinomadura scrupuli]|uniref:hypothetical protein n=1 Tax=Actinomadura scrupuli TaxID=559629 RepID=UPI003D98605D